jgi:hypothetical protein
VMIIDPKNGCVLGCFTRLVWDSSSQAIFKINAKSFVFKFRTVRWNAIRIFVITMPCTPTPLRQGLI